MLFLEFLAVGAWGFWALIVISAIVMSELVDNNSPGWATITAIATVAILSFLGDFNPLIWIKSNPGEVAFYIAAYFAVGAMWGVVKWYFWLQRLRRKMLEFKREHPGMDDADAIRFLRSAGAGPSMPPQVSEHKARIIGWMALWPASMVWTVLNDPVRRVFEEIYDRIGGGLQRMSNRIFGEFITDKDRR